MSCHAHHRAGLVGSAPSPAERIAAELVPALLALRTRLLVSDIRAVYRVSTQTAMLAVGHARRQALAKRGADTHPLPL